jgi:hypothetical protein
MHYTKPGVIKGQTLNRSTLLSMQEIWSFKRTCHTSIAPQSPDYRHAIKTHRSLAGEHWLLRLGCEEHALL